MFQQGISFDFTKKMSGWQALKRNACSTCQNPIQSTDMPIEAFNRVYHLSCFKCDQCGVSLNTSTAKEDPTMRGIILCEKHFKLKQDQKVCLGCGNVISGRAVEALGGYWHDTHLVCSHCQRPLFRGHIEHLGRVYCPDDYSTLFSQAMCKACRKPISDTQPQLKALNARWHKDCFRCGICQSSFPDKLFFVYDGRPYCKSDYYIAAKRTCKRCGETMHGKCIEVAEGRFHPECFSCTICKIPLTDTYYNLDDQFYCDFDIVKVQGGLDTATKRQTMLGNVQ